MRRPCPPGRARTRWTGRPPPSAAAHRRPCPGTPRPRGRCAYPRTTAGRDLGAPGVEAADPGRGAGEPAAAGERHDRGVDGHGVRCAPRTGAAGVAAHHVGLSLQLDGGGAQAGFVRPHSFCDGSPRRSGAPNFPAGPAVLPLREHQPVGPERQQGVADRLLSDRCGRTSFPPGNPGGPEKTPVPADHGTARRGVAWRGHGSDNGVATGVGKGRPATKARDTTPARTSHQSHPASNLFTAARKHRRLSRAA